MIAFVADKAMPKGTDYQAAQYGDEGDGPCAPGRERYPQPVKGKGVDGLDHELEEPDAQASAQADDDPGNAKQDGTGGDKAVQSTMDFTPERRSPLHTDVRLPDR